MEGEKYVVFKLSDWNDWVEGLNNGELIGPMNPPHLTDAVVIRPQDVFAGPGLLAYANNVQTGLEMMRALPGARVDPSTIIRLTHLRDFFHEKGMEAMAHPDKKIPD